MKVERSVVAGGMKDRQGRKAERKVVAVAAAGVDYDRTSPGSSSPAAAASPRWVAVSLWVHWESVVAAVAAVQRSIPSEGTVGVWTVGEARGRLLYWEGEQGRVVGGHRLRAGSA